MRCRRLVCKWSWLGCLVLRVEMVLYQMIRLSIGLWRSGLRRMLPPTVRLFLRAAFGPVLFLAVFVAKTTGPAPSLAVPAILRPGMPLCAGWTFDRSHDG